MPRFKGLIGTVYDLYRQGKHLNPNMMRVWFSALEGYELAVVAAAFTAHARNTDNGQFMPVPADIVKLIEGGSEDVALMAWNKLDRALRSVGTYRTVVFDDPLIHHAVTAMGGWIRLGTLTEDDWKYQRQPFVTLYRGARQRSIDFPPKLLGISESTNGAKHREAPILIGDEAKCRDVLARGVERPVIAMRPLAEALPQLQPPQERAA